MNITNFKWSLGKCIHCGKCLKVCPGDLFIFDDKNELKIKEIDCFGWDGCWQCDHCLAVCPTGAISIFNKDPQNSVTLPDYQDAGKMMSALVRTRRACRRYLNKDVDKKIIKELMGSIQYAPTGGNKRKLEFTIIDDCKEMDYFRLLVRDEMIKLANNGIYPQGFDKTSYNQMMAWEKSVRPDSIFCGAPHILIPQVPKNIPCAVQDVNMAAAYFELLCNANGLGAICMSYPLAVLGNMPNVMKLLQIPEDHYISLMVGFGYPEIRYARGVQREANGKIKRIVFTQD